MAAFATVVAAETRAKAKGPAGDNTWVYAHPGVTFTGSPCVRVVRRMPPGTNGGWVEITDDATV